jgi:putative restriction endonuclease
MTVEKWTREQTIVALNFYCKIPFNKVTSKNLDVLKAASIIGRSPNSVKMKIGNFGSFDPELKRRGIVGLANVSKLDRDIWNEFNGDWESLAYESELLIAKLSNEPLEAFVDFSIDYIPEGKERIALVKQRVNQQFFRKTVLASYDYKCCITQINIPEMLIASHIIPWSKNSHNRLNPRNGLCLNALHDKAFDLGLITISHDYKIKLSNKIKTTKNNEAMTDFFEKYEGKTISMPDKFIPSIDFIEYHQKNIFKI